MKKAVLGLLVLAALGLLAVWFLRSDLVSAARLSVLPQTPTDTVRVARAVLTSNGWVVARGIEGERLGQIIEISPFLPVGEHKDIEIRMGEFYKGEELVVMIYHDNDDGVFNDLDKPALDENGRFIGVYVRTGEPLPVRITDQSSGMDHFMPGMTDMTQVRYTDEGFLPKTIEVSAGTMVEFVNESGKQMWVASDVHPGHEQLPTFDQFNSSAPGTSYNYLFDKPGTWSYHDHLNPEDEGTVTVL